MLSAYCLAQKASPPILKIIILPKHSKHVEEEDTESSSEDEEKTKNREEFKFAEHLMEQDVEEQNLLFRDGMQY